MVYGHLLWELVRNCIRHDRLSLSLVTMESHQDDNNSNLIIILLMVYSQHFYLVAKLYICEIETKMRNQNKNIICIYTVCIINVYLNAFIN